MRGKPFVKGRGLPLGHLSRGPSLAFPAKGRGSPLLLGWERNEGLGGDMIWPTQLAHPPGFSVCLFKNVPAQKNFPSEISLGPMVILITMLWAGASSPGENWKLLARAQMFQNSPGILVIDRGSSLSTQMWSLTDKASSASSAPHS